MVEPGHVREISISIGADDDQIFGLVAFIELDTGAKGGLALPVTAPDDAFLHNLALSAAWSSRDGNLDHVGTPPTDADVAAWTAEWRALRGCVKSPGDFMRQRWDAPPVP